jgi:exosortase/archaeosortase family protein
MKIRKIKLPKKLNPLRGVILFAIVLMLSNFFWKYNIIGDDATKTDSIVTFWGLNISAPFVWMANHVSNTVYLILHFLKSPVQIIPINILRFPNGNSIHIIWACTGLKQAFICFCIMTFSRGPWCKKLWFVPLSLLVVYLFNIFRITFIVASVEKNSEWFDFLHFYAFKYVFYGIIFLMWVFWEERIVPFTNKSEDLN